MPSFNLRSADQMLLLYLSSLVLMTNLVGLTLANPLIMSINPVSSTNFVDQISPGHHTVPMTDNKGKFHDMIISTVSLDSWFATTASACPGTPNPDPHCGWNPNALYDPTGVSTTGTYCSIGVKDPTNVDIECYSIMPNISITLGENTAQNPNLPLYANVGILINSTWDGSQQSGMLGLAAPIDYDPTGPWNPILADMAVRYSQSRQFTLAFERGPGNGGCFTLGDALPPDALPLSDPSVFQTPMENTTFSGRVNNLYVVTAALAIVTAPNPPVQYIIDSGDIYLRVPSANAQAINSAWSPAGTPLNDGSGRWSVPCDAAAPTIGLTIGGHVFSIDKADMLVNQNDVCWSSVIDEKDGPFVLGWPLLVNVVVSFNLNTRIMYWQEPPGHAIAPTSSAVGSSAPPSSTPAAVPPTSPAAPSPTSATSISTTTTSAHTTTLATSASPSSARSTSARSSSASVSTSAPAAITPSSSKPSTTTAVIVPTTSQPPPITTGSWTTTIVGSSTSTTTVISLVIVTTSPSA